MVGTSSIIETGVDRLVRLVKERGKIAMQDAAKQLGLSKTVIEEWADFLEEEGIISLEHSLTKSYLIERKLTKKEVEVKAKEFSGKKDVFVRKAEVTTSFLEKEADKFKDVKNEFDKLKKELGFDLGSVRKELDELHKYEQLKINLDKQIQQQRESAKKKIGGFSETIEKEHKKYQQLLQEIKGEEEELKKEMQEALSVEEKETILKKRLSNFKATISRLEKRFDSEDEKIKNSEAHITRLKNLADQIKINTEKEKSLIEPLIEKSRQNEKKILDIQNKVIKKITEKEQRLRKAEKVSSKFRGFFDKKMKIINLIDKLNQDRNSLEKDLSDLIKKAKSFELTSKSADAGKEIMELEKKFKEVDQKKKAFEEIHKTLTKIFKA